MLTATPKRTYVLGVHRIQSNDYGQITSLVLPFQRRVSISDQEESSRVQTVDSALAYLGDPTGRKGISEPWGIHRMEGLISESLDSR